MSSSSRSSSSSFCIRAMAGSARDYNTLWGVMRKATASSADSASDVLRSIPSVERILSTATFVTLASEFGRERVKDSVGRHLAALRASRATWVEQEAAAAVRKDMVVTTSPTLRRVVNATGVIIH